MALRGVRGERGITGLETSIVMFESVVIVSVFAYTVLSAVTIASVATGRAIFATLNTTWSLVHLNSGVTVSPTPTGPTNADCAPGTIGSHSREGGTVDACSSGSGAESGVDPVPVSSNTSAPVFSSANEAWRFLRMNTSRRRQCAELPVEHAANGAMTDPLHDGDSAQPEPSHMTCGSAGDGEVVVEMVGWAEVAGKLTRNVVGLARRIGAVPAIKQAKSPGPRLGMGVN